MSIVSSISPEDIPQPVVWISAGMITVAVFLSLIRIVRGPTTPDRIIAVDLLAGLVMGGMLVAGITSGNPFYLQSVLGFAVILFLGTIALARYLDAPDTTDDDS